MSGVSFRHSSCMSVHQSWLSLFLKKVKKKISSTISNPEKTRKEEQQPIIPDLPWEAEWQLSSLSNPEVLFSLLQEAGFHQNIYTSVVACISQSQTAVLWSFLKISALNWITAVSETALTVSGHLGWIITQCKFVLWSDESASFFYPSNLSLVQNPVSVMV